MGKLASRNCAHALWVRLDRNISSNIYIYIYYINHTYYYTKYTIPNKFTYQTYHPYNTNHSYHTYHSYHIYQIYHIFQTYHIKPTIHTIHTQHNIPHPHHTTGGKEKKTHMGSVYKTHPIKEGEKEEKQKLTYIYIKKKNNIFKIYL